MVLVYFMVGVMFVAFYQDCGFLSKVTLIFGIYNILLALMRLCVFLPIFEGNRDCGLCLYIYQGVEFIIGGILLIILTCNFFIKFFIYFPFLN